MVWTDNFSLSVLGNTLQEYIIALAIAVLCGTILWVVSRIVISSSRRLTKKTKTRLDNILIDSIGAVTKPFYFLIGAYIGFQFVSTSAFVDRVLYVLLLIGAAFYGVRAISAAIIYIAGEHTRKTKGDDSSFPRLFATLITMVLWIIAFLFVLSNVGIEIGPLIAGLGIGGIAVAFALQGVLEDLFAAFSIYFDKPFKKGDFIIIGSDMGTVQRIGMKSTRIQTLQGQELVVSNKELTNTRINNYKRMSQRRIEFGFGVEYGTDQKHLKKIPEMIQKIIEKHELATFNRCHFKSFGESSLDFEVVYMLNSSDYNVYMDIQQDINLEINSQFAKKGINMAFPTRTVFLEK